MGTSFNTKDVFADHWDAFLDEGYPIRPDVLKILQKLIFCGKPSMGHALYYCDNCKRLKNAYFTCKSRFCNSCDAKYTQDCASSITSKLINCKHRHIVFTIPQELRFSFVEIESYFICFFKLVLILFFLGLTR